MRSITAVSTARDARSVTRMMTMFKKAYAFPLLETTY
jgi:hypothetical protein